MSNLWIYWRRPSSVVRYRHGGESSIYPMLKQPIVGSRETTKTAVAAQSTVVEAPAVSDDNILDFASAKRPAERTRPCAHPAAASQNGASRLTYRSFPAATHSSNSARILSSGG